MQESMLPYQMLADMVLLLHFAVVVFVVGGLAAIIIGNVRNWVWVNSLLFRIAHLAAVGVIVVQACLGEICSLTVLESWLRAQAGEPGYATSFIGHWVQRLLYYEAPFWIFTVAYTMFGALVAASWWCFPPRKRSH
jgi:hypothetical protein